MKYALIIPTLNAGTNAQLFLDALLSQSLNGFDRLIIDSTSNDGTPSIFTSAGFRIQTISRNQFNHGATRQLAVNLCPDADIIIFMTQDAILADPLSLQRLVAALTDSCVGVVYGRQLPSHNASPIATHARLYNYPAQSRVVSYDDISRLGVKAAFISNSFAAYRREALQSVGGFPSDVIFGEDTCVAARMLQSGWKIAYCAEAPVRHSHNYTMWEELRRYFDIGVFHSREKWFLELLGGAEGEGRKLVRSEFQFLSLKAPWYIPAACLRTLLKLSGYRLGMVEKHISVSVKKRLSMNRAFWR
jgi:rhamnosyltransferase